MHEGRGSGRTDRIGLPEGERLTRETKNVQTQIDSTPRARGDSSLQTQCSSPRTQGAARGRLCGLPPSPGLGGRGARGPTQASSKEKRAAQLCRWTHLLRKERRKSPRAPSAIRCHRRRCAGATCSCPGRGGRGPLASGGQGLPSLPRGAQSARRPHPGSRPAFWQSRSAAASLPPSDRSHHGRTDGSGSDAFASRALLT